MGIPVRPYASHKPAMDKHLPWIELVGKVTIYRAPVKRASAPDQCEAQPQSYHNRQPNPPLPVPPKPLSFLYAQKNPLHHRLFRLEPLLYFCHKPQRNSVWKRERESMSESLSNIESILREDRKFEPNPDF